MSNPRYDWWGYVKGMIRRYPALKAEHDDLISQSITPAYSGLPGNGGTKRTTEETVTIPLQKTSMREYYAVREAIVATKAIPDGEDRIKLICLVFWNKTHSLIGAALECGVKERTGQEWHRQFIRTVAKNYGLMD